MVCKLNGHYYYMDIIIWERLLSIVVANIENTYRSVRSSCRRGVDGSIVILANCKNYFIRVSEILVHYPSNKISIVYRVAGTCQFRMLIEDPKICQVILFDSKVYILAESLDPESLNPFTLLAILNLHEF